MSDYDDGALWHELDRLRDEVRRLEGRIAELEHTDERRRFERQDIDRRLTELEDPR